MENAAKRVFGCKDRRRYSRKQAKFCRNFAKNLQLPYGSPRGAAAASAVEGRAAREERVPGVVLQPARRGRERGHHDYVPQLFTEWKLILKIDLSQRRVNKYASISIIG